MYNGFQLQIDWPSQRQQQQEQTNDYNNNSTRLYYASDCLAGVVGLCILPGVFVLKKGQTYCSVEQQSHSFQIHSHAFEISQRPPCTSVPRPSKKTIPHSET